MDCDELRDDQWERLKALLPGVAKASGVREQTTGFLNALLWMARFWMARSGGRWRDLPAWGLP